MQDIMKTLEVYILAPHLWGNNRVPDVSCIFFTLSKILKPKQVRKMHTVWGQGIGGLAVLSQSVWRQSRCCWHHAFLSVHLTPLGGRARRPEEDRDNVYGTDFYRCCCAHVSIALCMFAMYLYSEALLRLAMPRRGDPSGRVFVSTLRLSWLFREAISETSIKGFSTTHCKCCILEFSILKRSIFSDLSFKWEFLALCRGLDVMVQLPVTLPVLVTMGKPELWARLWIIVCASSASSTTSLISCSCWSLVLLLVVASAGE